MVAEEREQMTKFDFKTKPFDHQLKDLIKSCDLEAFGVFWEQGTGKTKLAIDTAAYLYKRGDIDALLVVAPDGVHTNWTEEEIPEHMPLSILDKIGMLPYQAGKASTKWHQLKCTKLLKYTDGLAVLTISYDGFMTDRGKKFVWQFLRNRRCFYVLDEGHYIKTPKAKRTKSIVSSGKYAPYRRIMTGTPVTDKPFDVYSQVKFLDENFWHQFGVATFAAFKMKYGVWFTRAEAQQVLGYDPGYDRLIEYKNLDHLQEVLKQLGSRVLKDDVLDLPPKLYSKRSFEMSSTQWRHYKELQEEFYTELASGSVVEASLAIVRLLRMQQITCGYVGTEIGEPVEMIDEKNRRLDLAVEILENLGHKAIIWSRFIKDIDQLMDALGDRAVRYDGRVSKDDIERAKKDFQHGDAQFFVANIAKNTGITLTAAKTVLYYNNNFKLTDRLQSEDRAHRAGLKHAVNYIDLFARGTVDEKIIGALRGKRNIAASITGDELTEWI